MYIERDNARERGRIHARLPTMDTAVAPTATNASREAYTTPRFFLKRLVVFRNTSMGNGDAAWLVFRFPESASVLEK